MSTSGSTNFSTSRDELIRGALRAAGGISQGETPTTVQITEAAEALNMMVKAFQADGMPLWAIKEYNIPLTGGVASYEIGLSKTINIPKPLKVIGGFLRNTTTGLDIPMLPLTRQDYNSLGNKTSQGTPVQYWYDPQSTYGILTVFQVPTTTIAVDNFVRIVYQRPYEDFDASTDEPDFPQEWYEAIKFNLADRLAPEYGLPLQERQDLASRARLTKDTALGFGTEEGSFRFQADLRSW
jgi:hypothetical protein